MYHQNFMPIGATVAAISVTGQREKQRMVGNQFWQVFLVLAHPVCSRTMAVKCLLLVGCIDFPVDKVVTVEGSADNTSMTPTPPVPSASGSDAAPAIVSEVVPPTSPVLSDVKCNAVPVNQSSPSPQPPGQISPTDRPAEAAEPPQLVVETEAQDAGLTDRTRSPSPSNDVVTSEQRSTEAESRSQLPDAMDDTTASVPVSESS